MIGEIARATWEILVIVVKATLFAWVLTGALLLVSFVVWFPVFLLSTRLDCWTGGACS